MRPIEYWIVRYVPEPIRGEYVNVGLIATDGERWSFRRTESLRRARALAGREPRAAEVWLPRLESEFDEEMVNSSDGHRVRVWLEHERARLNNQIQIGAKREASAGDLDVVADVLFETLIVQRSAEHRSRVRSESVDAIEHGVRERWPDRRVRKDVLVVVGRQEAPIDLAVTGHDGVDALSQVWSFGVKDKKSLVRRLMASAFTLEQLRVTGGEVRSRRTATADVIGALKADVPVVMVTVPPENDAERDVLAVAHDAWEKAGLQWVPSTDREVILDRLDGRGQELVGA